MQIKPVKSAIKLNPNAEYELSYEGAKEMLMFDEATSALDNITQRKISEAIDSLKCTRIIIAHRLSTIQHADRIIFLEKGKIVEDGTYEELIAKNGYFAKLVERQRLDV